MTDTPPDRKAGPKAPAPRQAAVRERTAESREDRLKAALKANLARRKAQARSRAQARRAEGADDNEQ